jgi:hypothetical protein
MPASRCAREVKAIEACRQLEHLLDGIGDAANQDLMTANRLGVNAGHRRLHPLRRQSQGLTIHDKLNRRAHRALPQVGILIIIYYFYTFHPFIARMRRESRGSPVVSERADAPSP